MEKQIFFRKMVGNEFAMSEALEKGKELGMELSASWYKEFCREKARGKQAADKPDAACVPWHIKDIAYQI